MQAGERRVFFDVHSGLPREAPGSTASTVRALSLAGDLGNVRRVLDIGCGPGMQTIDLGRRLPGAHVSAVDLNPPFLTEVARRAGAGGLGNVSPLRADMRDLPFAAGTFDLIWCEGAVYIMGVAEALTAWRDLLAPDARLALTERSG